jgi:tetratricopeptide (TPR) repeat protein
MLLAATYGQHGDASAGEEDHELDPVQTCLQRAVEKNNRLEFDKSRVTWKRCLQLMEENGEEEMPRYKDAVKSYGQAWYKSLRSGGDERLEKDCTMVEALGLGHSKEYATCLSLLALVHDKADDIKKAERRYRQSIALREELGLASSNDFHVLVCNLGNVLRRARQRDEAIATMSRCIDMFEAAGDVNTWEYVLALQNYGATVYDSREGLKILSKAKRIAESLGMQHLDGYQTILMNLEALRVRHF